MSGICQCLCVGMLWFPAGDALVREAEQEEAELYLKDFVTNSG